MAFSFFPREDKFFDLFDRQAKAILNTSNYFKDLVREGDFDDVSVLKMHDYEHECDVNTHDIIGLLNRSFITPFDREDIHQLAQELDNIVDMSVELGAAVSLATSTFMGIPVSTTQTIAGSIMGIGMLKRFTSVRWQVARGWPYMDTHYPMFGHTLSLFYLLIRHFKI